MKDYSNGKDENFILNYKEKEDKIIINFASSSFKKLVIDNTEENKNKILNKMRKQILEQDEDKMSHIFSKNDVLSAIIAIAAIVCFVPILILKDLSTLIFLGIGCICFTTAAFLSAIKYKKAADYMKNKEYIKNEEEINKSIKDDKYVLENTNKKVKNIALQSDEPKFDLNSIDKLSYNELKQLLENIKRLDEFNFEHTEKEKQKELIKK